MNENPIWTKDSMLSDRSLFLPLLISFGNLILFILFIANLYYINLNGLQTGEIRYAGFLQMYYFVAIGLFLFLLLLAPAITVSGMSMEEDEHMLELLLETDLDSRSIIFGKLYSELSTLGTFLLSTLPFLATVFIYGGIPYTYLFLYFTFLRFFKFPRDCLHRSCQKQCLCDHFGVWNQLFVLCGTVLRDLCCAKYEIFCLCPRAVPASSDSVFSILLGTGKEDAGKALSRGKSIVYKA